MNPLPPVEDVGGLKKDGVGWGAVLGVIWLNVFAWAWVIWRLWLK